MRYKATLRKMNGRWFMAIGSKGYATTTSFEKFLEEVKPTTVYISEVPCDPWFVVTAERNGDKYITTFTEVSSNESQAVEQCSKVEDLDLPTQFYINRGDS